MVGVRGAQCRDALRTSFALETTSTRRNKRDQGKRKHSEINEADRFTAAHNGLAAGSSPAGPTNEPMVYQAYRHCALEPELHRQCRRKSRIARFVAGERLAPLTGAIFVLLAKPR